MPSRPERKQPGTDCSGDNRIDAKILRQMLSAVLGRLDSLLRSYDNPAIVGVVERDYTDLDYTVSYYDQRVRSFLPPARETTRIHFFSDSLTLQDIIDAREETTKATEAGYLGRDGECGRR